MGGRSSSRFIRLLKAPAGTTCGAAGIVRGTAGIAGPDAFPGILKPVAGIIHGAARIAGPDAFPGILSDTGML